MLSFAELRRAARVVDSRFAGYRVERISQPGPFQLVLTCYGREDRAERGTKRHLFLSCDPVLARVAELERPMPSAERPPAFLQFVRPRLEGARLRSARVASGERQLSLHLEAGDGRFELLLSLLGRSGSAGRCGPGRRGPGWRPARCRRCSCRCCSRRRSAWTTARR